MPLFNHFTNFIRDAVGNNMTNQEKDVRTTKDHLSRLGYLP